MESERIKRESGSEQSLSLMNGWSRVGDPGNTAMSDGLGSVATVFEIQKYPVTNEAYAWFLNELPLDERETRYTSLMADHFFGGIERDSSKGKFYPKSGFAKKPVVFVSWFDAQRFAQFLGENDGEWSYRLPTRDEWLKAAAFRGKRGWAKYLTGEAEAPSQNPTDKNSANYYDPCVGWALPAPHLADVDLYTHESYYGTVGQAGNCAEWVDAEMRGNGWKFALGGALFRPIQSLLTTSSEGDSPEKKLSTFGFRLVRVKKGMVVERGTSICSSASCSQILLPTSSFDCALSFPTDCADKEYVQIGDPFNPPDVVYGGFGRVNYVFEMARYALTNREYADFLNAVAKTSDPFGLFHKDMQSGVLGGIERRESAEGWNYLTKEGWSGKPVVYINYCSLARYANWLHYGCPRTGRSEEGTTEGTDTQGAYDTRFFEEVCAGRKKVWRKFGFRNKGARYWIPNANEWYKAAYYDPEKVSWHKYWEYPTRSSAPPDNKPSAPAPAANYEKAESFGIGSPYYLADVQDYASSKSYYGTVQQGGNVWEWIEDWAQGRVGQWSLRGGSFGYTEFGLHACNTDPAGLNDRSYVFGGRLARAVSQKGWRSVPTPLIMRLKEVRRNFLRIMKLLCQ